ncbi:MAG: RidA family protein [Magnetococcales bacterium]|nr:RidA family protein [Magnetococcales bacterium]
MTQKPTAVQTTGAPQAIGPYSQGIRVGPWLFLSGQIPLDPESGALCVGDVAEETARIMDNLGAVLAAAGVGFAQVVKTTLYLVDMGDFAMVNAVYASYLQPPYPARATIGVATLPKGARVEIEAVAWVAE